MEHFFWKAEKPDAMIEENRIVPWTSKYGSKKIGVDLVRCDRAKRGRGKS